jgi:phospholipase/lecithinase/hemolysin
VVDDLHQKQFMKVELYSNEVNQTDLAVVFATIAKQFFYHHAYTEAQLVETAEGFDLEVGGIEVGSYSSRVYSGHAWTCGTGLAEPRFSTARNLLQQRL